MACCQHRRANTGYHNINQERDHQDLIILKGLGEQIYQIEEHIECLDATGREAFHQEMDSIGPFL
jgi:hypothetical protein